MDRPYTQIYGAAALFESKLVDNALVESTDTTNHSNSDKLVLLIIKGTEMMPLVHELYRRAADEA